MRVVFMGTPDFAVPVLEKLIAAGHEVAGVVTQPDRPRGRGKMIQYTPVKQVAVQAGIPVWQPVKVREPEFVEQLRTLQPEVIVVAAFGQILPEEILKLPKYGCVNVHASLLPKYRGAAPIQWAVVNGERLSGVTTMRMDVGLDTGDMILKTEVILDKEETGGSLHDKLAKAGAELLIRTLEQLEDGTAKFEKQNDEASSYARMLDKKQGCIDWRQPAGQIECLIRGLNPWPSAYTHYQGKILKIWKAEVLEAVEEPAAEQVCGTIVKVAKDALHVQTGQGQLKLMELQLQGKKRMETEAFLRGCQMHEGEKFGK